jgi:hypothetical protein
MVLTPFVKFYALREAMIKFLLKLTSVVIFIIIFNKLTYATITLPIHIRDKTSTTATFAE